MHAKIVLHAVWTSSGFRHNMGSCWVCSFNLYKAFCANSLITTSRVVDVGRIILSETSGWMASKKAGGYVPRNIWDIRRRLYIWQLLDIEHLLSLWKTVWIASVHASILQNDSTRDRIEQPRFLGGPSWLPESAHHPSHPRNPPVADRTVLACVHI